MWKFAVLFCVAGTLSGCYFFYPTAVPSVPGPAVVEGAQIEVSTEKKKQYSSCSDNDLKHDLCEVHGGEWKKPYFEYIARATYGGRKLTQGEFFMLTGSTYPALVNEVIAKKGTCNISLVPSAIAVAGALFALVTLAGGDNISKNTDTQLLLYGIGAGTFLAGAAASYPLGGYACRSAGKLGDSVEMNNSGEGLFTGGDPEKIEQIQQLAEAFNAKHAAGVPREEPAPDDSTTPPAAAPATEGSVLSALQASGNFKTFLRILDAADGAKTLDKDGPLTVFAPTDEAFAKASPDLVTGLETNKKDAESFMQGHIAKGAHPLSEMKHKRMSVRTVYGSDISLKQGGGTVHVDRGELVGEPVTATNGVLYAVDSAE